MSDLNYSMTVFRVVREKKQSGTYVERHEHEYFHYIYALSGRAMIEVDYNQFDVTERTLIMVPPRVIHAVYSIRNFVGIDIKFLCDESLTEKLGKIGYCLNRATDYEDSLLKAIFLESVRQQHYFEQTINLNMLQMSYNILKREKMGLFMVSPNHFIEEAPTRTVSLKSIQSALDFIKNNINTDIKISDLARICNYNENYFSTCFKNCIGCSPQNYINYKKIEKATALMISGEKSITQIADELGFNSIHYFSRLFKKITGFPPSVYQGKTSIDIGINLQTNKYTPASYFEFQVKSMK